MHKAPLTRTPEETRESSEQVTCGEKLLDPQGEAYLEETYPVCRCVWVPNS